MLKYIIRLDDACPNMDYNKWSRIEILLNKYNIKPIVGVIPDNRDPEFNYPRIDNFWDIVRRWQANEWIIAQHGLHHSLSDTVRTEFSGKDFKTQLQIITEGFNILQKENIKPICFFAPAHTFDSNTIKACKKIDSFKFISDGYAFYPYSKEDMLLIPSVFDTPHKISNNGIFTFVYHPNKMDDEDFNYLEDFIKKHNKEFEVDIDSIVLKYKKRRKKIFDYLLHMSIYSYRGVAKLWKKGK